METSGGGIGKYIFRIGSQFIVSFIFACVIFFGWQLLVNRFNLIGFIIAIGVGNYSGVVIVDSIKQKYNSN